MSGGGEIAWYRVTLYAAQLVRAEVLVRATTPDVARTVAEQERDMIAPSDWKAVGEPGPLHAVTVRQTTGWEDKEGGTR